MLCTMLLAPLSESDGLVLAPVMADGYFVKAAIGSCDTRKRLVAFTAKHGRWTSVVPQVFISLQLQIQTRWCLDP